MYLLIFLSLFEARGKFHVFQSRTMLREVYERSIAEQTLGIFCLLSCLLSVENLLKTCNIIRLIWANFWLNMKKLRRVGNEGNFPKKTINMIVNHVCFGRDLTKPESLFKTGNSK